MAGFEEIIERGSPTDPLVPEPIVQQVIQNLPTQSVLLSRAKQVPLTSKTGKQPVLSALPAAYWVGGDTGLKQTTKAQWENVVITAEELAAIVVIPDQYFDDASIPLWDQIRPLLVEAVGVKVDEAGIFGVDKPSTWPTAIVPGAAAAGNVIAEGAGDDLGVDVASLGQLLASQGYNMNGFAAAPGLQWKLVGLRNADGVPIYTQSLAENTPSGLYGLPLNEVDNGSWNDDVSIIGADWSKFVVGVRQEMQFKIFSEGVISDDDGVIIVNLMQQDAKAMRVTFRVGFQIANPINRVEPTAADRYPAGYVTNAASA